MEVIGASTPMAGMTNRAGAGAGSATGGATARGDGPLDGQRTRGATGDLRPSAVPPKPVSIPPVGAAPPPSASVWTWPASPPPRCTTITV